MRYFEHVISLPCLFLYFSHSLIHEMNDTGLFSMPSITVMYLTVDWYRCKIGERVLKQATIWIYLSLK